MADWFEPVKKDTNKTQSNEKWFTPSKYYDPAKVLKGVTPLYTIKQQEQEAQEKEPTLLDKVYLSSAKQKQSTGADLNVPEIGVTMKYNVEPVKNPKNISQAINYKAELDKKETEKFEKAIQKTDDFSISGKALTDLSGITDKKTYQNIINREGIYQYMTDDERRIYKYLIAKKDNASARKYLLDKMSDLESRKAYAVAGSNEGGFIGTVKDFSTAAKSGLESGLTNMARMGVAGNIAAGNNMGVLNKLLEPTYSEKLYEQVRANAKDKGYVYGVLLDATNSIAAQLPQIAMGAAGGSGAYLSAMALQIIGADTTEAINQGYDGMRGVVYGIFDTALEFATEKVLGGIASKLDGGETSRLVRAALNAVDSTVSNKKVANALAKTISVLSSANSEGVEEFLQAVIEPVMRNVIYGERNNLNAETFKEAVRAYIVGAVSGGIMDIPFANNTLENTRADITGKFLKENAGVESVLKLSEVVGNNSELYGEIKSSFDGGRDVSNTDLAMLYQQSAIMFEQPSEETYKNFAERNVDALIKEAVNRQSNESKPDSESAKYMVESANSQLQNGAESDIISSRGESYVRTDEFRRLQAESKGMSDEDIQLYHSGKREVNDELRKNISGILRSQIDAARNGVRNDYGILNLSAKGNQFNLYQNVDGELFHDVFEIARSYLRNGELVDLHGVNTTDDGIGYNDCFNYLSEDGLSGFSITPDGDLISVFNASGKPGFLNAIAPQVKEKVKTLDCYNSSNQPLMGMYSKIFGFKTASVMDYNMEYDHDNIAENHGNPQVAFMVNTEAEVETRHFTKEQYDEAKTYRDSFIDDTNSPTFGTNNTVSFSDKNDVQADKADTKRDSYAKDESFWKAENSNEKSEKNSTLVSKLKALFGNEKGDSTVSVGEIVKLIEKDFGIPVSKGKFRERAYGIYKVKAEAIRTKISNALPTIGHELGHHLDKKYNLRNFQSINEAMRVLKDARPNFYNSYPPEARPGEAVAEFIRNYLADRTLAKRSYPFFYEEFERVLSEKGSEDLKNLKTIGDKINEYFTAEKADRARAAVISREEARKRNATDKEVADYLEAFETNFVDEAAPLKKISKKAYNLFYYAKKADVRARSAIVGDGVASFDGENGGLAYMRDVDGNIIKDSDGKPLNMQPLQKILAEIDNKSKPDFEMYLVYKHGLEFLENDKRVFADDSINDKEFISKEIKRLEKAYPQFKKTAEELYSWYKSFIYEYGVKSGLLSKEQYKALNEKYPCYVPFNRNADGGSKGVKKSVANQKAPIMRAKGSGLEILSPIESITQKVAQFMNAADRNAVMQDIANKADNVEGLGYLLEQVPPDMMPVTVSTESIKKGINEWYREQSENGNLPDDFTDTIDEIIGDTVTQFVQSNNQGRNVVWVYRKGKKTLYQVHDPNLLTALTGLNKPQFGAFTRAVGNITRLFKVLTTGGNFAWSITSNTPRDFNSAYKYSVEKNPIKFTVDYVRAVISAFSQVRGDKASDIVKLYKTVGGGYNNSLIYNSKELKTTMSELIKKDESYLKHFISRFNLIEAIEQLADFIETAPRLAEFKRVYEQTGDTQKALLAAEEITVNFNRSGSKSKVIDQYIPYFNAGIQGVNKLVSTALDSEKNKAFFAKTVVSGVITVGLLFAWNMLAMGDDDNDEYEKLSAYKKNNFYNFYIGNGKFFSIPKSKDTAVFDSTLERVFEIALKEDVDYSQEIKDYLSYLWLVFAPPLPTDAIILSTAKDLWRNEDFKGTPIVSSYYEKLEPKEQYNEKTTYIAKALGQLTGYSPMKIDHIINSNLGILGLLNKSLGRAEKDWLLGIGTKLITDNAYSTDILNQFYNNADKYEKKANSYPDNAEAVYKNKQYSAAKSVISALNKYGKENPDSAREIKILARDYADSFEKNSGIDKKLLGLLERTGDKDILYDKTFSREYSIDKVKYTMDLEDYLDYVDEYYDKIEKEYDRILTMNVSDEYTAEMLKNAKEEVSDELADKYKVVK